MQQEKAFFDGEGDEWYRRNRESLLQPEKVDWPIALMERNNLQPRRVLELGCSNGWRLAMLPSQADQLVGLDVSAAAIAEGKRLYPGLTLIRGKVSAVPLEDKFDLIIVNFVLHWVDRCNIASTIAEIDRLLANHGMLIIGDFWPENPTRRHYHHLPEDDVWTWKNDYPQMFQSFGTYQKVDSQVFFHNSPGTKIPLETSSGRASCVLLQKDLSCGYEIEI
jgi:SAM-dependent methyltransferase